MDTWTRLTLSEPGRQSILGSAVPDVPIPSSGEDKINGLKYGSPFRSDFLASVRQQIDATGY